MIRNDPARKRSFAAPDAALEHPPSRSWTRPQKCLSAITKGGVPTVGRWNGDGRKGEPTERFRGRYWRFIGYEHFRGKRLATFSLDWGRTLVPSFEGPTAHAEAASLRRPTVTGLMARTRRRRGRRRADLRSSAFVPTYKCPASDRRASGRQRRHDAGPLSATPASRRTPKADKRRTEGGNHRPISAPSMSIVCHEPLGPGRGQGLDLLPNAARRRLAEYRRWTNGGRKVEPTDQFWPRHWRSIGYEHCNDETVVAVISPDRGRTLAPSACRRGCN